MLPLHHPTDPTTGKISNRAADYRVGARYERVCAARHAGTFEGLTNGFLHFQCEQGCGPCYYGPAR